MTRDDAETLKQRIIEILHEELYGQGKGDIDGRQKAADRIIAEIIAPIQAAHKPSI